MTEPEDCPSDTHSYSAYAAKKNPCRCSRGKAEKARYIRERRAKARAEITGDGHVVDGIKHGSTYGHDEKGCRCELCVAARRAADRRYRERKKAKR